jgi:hypothetical protein
MYFGNIDSIKLNGQIDLLNLNVSVRGRLIGYAAAYFVARKTMMPSAPVTNPSTYFIENLTESVKASLSEINEVTVFDFTQAVAAAKAFWMVRYQALHPSCADHLNTNKYDFFCSAFAVETQFSNEDYEFLTANRTNIFAVCQALKNYVIEGA